MKISINNEYMRGERKLVEKAATEILEKQQQDFIDILREYGGKVVTKNDGTYGTRGHNSPDCFVKGLKF